MSRATISSDQAVAREGRRFSVSRLIVALLAIIALLFLILPILGLIGFAVSTQAWQEAPTMAIVQAITLSAITTALTALITLLFGTPLAYVFARGRFPLRRVLNIVIELPIILPPAVAGLGLLVTWGRRGVFGGELYALGISLPFTTAAVVVAQTFVAAPFYIRSAQVGFQGVPRDIEEAARVDGAEGLTLFRLITLPLASRSLIAGLVLSWARALGEFGATVLFAGSLQGRTQTMPLLIYNILDVDINAAVWAGLILVGVALIALLISVWLRRDDRDASLM